MAGAQLRGMLQPERSYESCYGLGRCCGRCYGPGLSYESCYLGALSRAVAMIQEPLWPRRSRGPWCCCKCYAGVLFLALLWTRLRVGVLL